MTPDHWAILGGLAAYAGLEYWIGKTDRVKSRSVVEFALSVGKSALAIAFRKRF